MPTLLVLASTKSRSVSAGDCGIDRSVLPAGWGVTEVSVWDRAVREESSSESVAQDDLNARNLYPVARSIPVMDGGETNLNVFGYGLRHGKTKRCGAVGLIDRDGDVAVVNRDATKEEVCCGRSTSIRDGERWRQAAFRSTVRTGWAGGRSPPHPIRFTVCHGRSAPLL